MKRYVLGIGAVAVIAVLGLFASSTFSAFTWSVDGHTFEECREISSDSQKYKAVCDNLGGDNIGDRYGREGIGNLYAPDHVYGSPMGYQYSNGWYRDWFVDYVDAKVVSKEKFSTNCIEREKGFTVCTNDEEASQKLGQFSSNDLSSRTDSYKAVHHVIVEEEYPQTVLDQVRKNGSCKIAANIEGGDGGVMFFKFKGDLDVGGTGLSCKGMPIISGYGSDHLPSLKDQAVEWEVLEGNGYEKDLETWNRVIWKADTVKGIFNVNIDFVKRLEGYIVSGSSCKERTFVEGEEPSDFYESKDRCLESLDSDDSESSNENDNTSDSTEESDESSSSANVGLIQGLKNFISGFLEGVMS